MRRFWLAQITSLLSLVGPATSFADYAAIQSGFWNDPSTWIDGFNLPGRSSPQANDSAVIGRPGFNLPPLTVALDRDQAVRTLDVRAGELNLNGHDLLASSLSVGWYDDSATLNRSSGGSLHVADLTVSQSLVTIEASDTLTGSARVSEGGTLVLNGTFNVAEVDVADGSQLVVNENLTVEHLDVYYASLEVNSAVVVAEAAYLMGVIDLEGSTLEAQTLYLDYGTVLRGGGLRLGRAVIPGGILELDQGDSVTGDIQIDSGGRLVIGAPLSTLGSIRTMNGHIDLNADLTAQSLYLDGNLSLNGHTFTATQVSMDLYGQISGGGTINGNLTGAFEKISLGDSPSILNVNGNLYGDFNTIVLGLGGANNLDSLLPQHDQIVVDGQVSLNDGVVQVGFFDSGFRPYHPRHGDVFELLTATEGIAAENLRWSLPRLSRGEWQIFQDANSLSLRAWGVPEPGALVLMLLGLVVSIQNRRRFV